MSILSGLKDKLKKEVVDKVAAAVKSEVEKAKEAAAELEAEKEAPTGSVIGGGMASNSTIGGHTGFVIGGGSAAPEGEYHEKSWYQDVPAEECQFNYPGTYLEYFDMIFREDFPEYQVEFAAVQPRRKYTYTFRRDGAEALVVELMASACESNQIRKECMARQLPYLRFYFDHNGWWNTRAYVKKRVGKALGR